MSVEFDQENSFNKTFMDNNRKSSSSKMSAYLIKKGYAKSEQQANKILIIISLLFIILTIFSYYQFVFGGNLFQKKVNTENAKIIQEYREQGLKGKELLDKINEARQSGILK